MIKARVICLHNPGEDILLFRRCIDVLTSYGYEVVYYRTNDNAETHVCTIESIMDEIDTVVSLCHEDIANSPHPQTPIHIMGHFISGAEALLYGIQGSQREKVSTIVGINPLVQPAELLMKQSSSLKLRWRAKMNPNAIVDLGTDLSLFTKDTPWLEFLRSESYSFTKLSNLQLKMIQDISHLLLNKKYTSQFTVANVLIIQSLEDPLTCASATHQFINNVAGAKQAYLLEYTKGMNNLFLEREKLFQRVITDLVSWLKEN